MMIRQNKRPLKQFLLSQMIRHFLQCSRAVLLTSVLERIDSIAMDMKEKKLTVIGNVDPVNVVSKLRKYWPMTDIMLVGPAKEPEKEKKEEPKKEGGGDTTKKEGEAPKEEGKKEGEAPKNEEKKEGGDKKAGEKKDQPQPQLQLPPSDHVLELVKAYKAYNPHLTTYYYAQSIEENPNACIIC